MTSRGGHIFRKVKQLHFVGIGGSGMSGIAEILLTLGFSVSGSDLRKSEITEKLEQLGAKIFYGHSPDNVGDPDVVVVSSAVRGDNPEIKTACEKGIPVIPRAEMLAEIMRLNDYGIAIAGTHGKSTTSSLIAEVLIEAGLDPTVIVGGKVVNLGSSARLGKGGYLVAEADEFDRSFLKLWPTIAVITNMEPEHMECYAGIDDLRSAFLEFANRVPFYGAVVLCIDEPMLQEMLPEIERRAITYGLSTQADIRAVKIHFNSAGTDFVVMMNENVLGAIHTSLIGLHNVKNALASVCVALEMGIDFPVIQNALEKFKGVFRRFQFKGEVSHILVVDDFAHHPTEVSVTLQAAKMAYDRRVVAVFQPHLFSRTQAFYLDFGKAFLNSDVLIVTEIFPAREEPIPGVSGELIATAAKDYGHKDVRFIPEVEDISETLLDITKPGDLVITIGAGNVWRVGEEFLKKLRSKYEPVSVDAD